MQWLNDLKVSNGKEENLLLDLPRLAEFVQILHGISLTQLLAKTKQFLNKEFKLEYRKILTLDVLAELEPEETKVIDTKPNNTNHHPFSTSSISTHTDIKNMKLFTRTAIKSYYEIQIKCKSIG